LRIVVIGAGVVGVTTAWLLAESGHEVELIDKHKKVAQGASYANAGQLSYQFASPVGSMQVLGKLPCIISGKDAGFRVRPTLSLSFLAWSSRFLFHCLPQSSAKNSAALKKLTRASKRIIETINNNSKIAFGFREAGKLEIFSNAQSFKRATAGGKLNSEASGRVVSSNECLSLAPALQHYPSKIVGGVYAEQDAVGNAAAYSEQLLADARDRLDVRCQFDCPIKKIVVKNNQARGVITESEEFIEADRIVVCTGSDEHALLREHHIKTHIMPIRGYSVTLPLGSEVPQVAITDNENKTVCSRIGDEVRIAGFADLGCNTEEHSADRIRTLMELMQNTFPTVANYAAPTETWAGERPATPDSLPIVGQSKVQHLFLNIGHGMYGWTLAPVCGDLIKEKINASA